MSMFAVYILMFFISQGIGYLIAARMFGPQVAYRNVRHNVPWMVLGFSLPFVLGKIGGSYSIYILLVACPIVVSAWLLDWFIRKRSAGRLVLNAGKTTQNKLLLLLGTVTGAFVLHINWVDTFIVPGSEVVIRSLSPNILFGIMPVLFIAIGLSGLELREKGVCFMLMFISWQQIKSYSWEASKPNTLTFRYAPRFPLMPGFMSIRVPASHREEIDRVFKLRIPAAIIS